MHQLNFVKIMLNKTKVSLISSDYMLLHSKLRKIVKHLKLLYILHEPNE